MKKTGFAVIGTGYIADYHVRGILEDERAEIHAVVSRDITKAQKFAAQYEIPAAFDSLDGILDNDAIDAVVICTPNAFHAPYAIQLLSRGKDVFINKPLAMNAAEDEEIKKAAEDNDRVIMTGHMWRFDADTEYIKQSIDSGKLGKIFKTRGYGIHENWGPSGWFTKKELAGGGALADMGVHAIDTVRYLLGDPMPVSVYARIATHGGDDDVNDTGMIEITQDKGREMDVEMGVHAIDTVRYLLGDPMPVSVYARIATHFGDYDVDDTGIIHITWDNGTESIVESGWWQPHMDGPEASTGLYGTKGYASLFPTYLKLTKGEESFEKIVPELPDREEHCDQIIYTRQMAHFIDCVQHRDQPSPGVEEGLVVLRIVDAAYESSRTGQVVYLQKK